MAFARYKSRIETNAMDHQGEGPTESTVTFACQHLASSWVRKACHGELKLWRLERFCGCRLLDRFSSEKGALKSFTAECEALRNIRHRNLLKIITSCSTIDSKGNDFRALVFDFMPNGSLEEWLHRKVPEKIHLNLAQRLNIALDVASAIEYIHDQGVTPIVHCDLKPSNVLLDDDMSAHVGDFGLARFIYGNTNASSHDSTLSVALKGSIGYVAPEYGMGGRPSKQGDVYSYGILVLEMLTGKRPTDDMFKEGLVLRKFVEAASPERVLEFVDQSILLWENYSIRYGIGE